MLFIDGKYKCKARRETGDDITTVIASFTFFRFASQLQLKYF